MESNLAVLAIALIVVSEIDLHLSGATTLCVLNNGALLLAGGDLFAQRVVRHLVVELDISVILH